MPMAKCRRCNGTGYYSDTNPTNGHANWCEGCKGDGQVSVIDPLSICKRCKGTGYYSDTNPTNGHANWCAGCAGSGYAS
ncbi:MAG: hypothetical protein IPJ13_28645 [Saprospiraceae bacterium]|jgi:DnaJ-class molecular chaperone|nr:hypothetical protein [Saprospiraceae bacterium]